jgi:hypothetical protein
MTCENKKLTKKKTIKEKLIRRCTISRIDRTPQTWGYKPPVSSPFIRLSGKWLERVGFKIGDQIDIIVMKDVLVIRPAEPFSNK